VQSVAVERNAKLTETSGSRRGHEALVQSRLERVWSG
jgi:hypothetical protein